VVSSPDSQFAGILGSIIGSAVACLQLIFNLLFVDNVRVTKLNIYLLTYLMILMDPRLRFDSTYWPVRLLLEILAPLGHI